MKRLSSVMVRTVIALLCVMTASLTLVITLGSQAVTKNQYRANIAQEEASIDSLSQVLDHEFYNYLSLATQITAHKDLRPINLSRNDPVAQIRARELLSALKGANSRIIDICLYFRAEDFFVTSVATYQPTSFISSYYSFGLISRADVYALFRDAENAQAKQAYPFFLPVGKVNTSDNDTAVSDALLFLLPLSRWSSNPYATLGILFQTNDIREQLSIVAGEGAARILDASGATLVSVGEESLAGGFAEDSSVRVFRRASARFGLTYEAYIKESALSRTNYASTGLILTITLMALLVALACLFFAQWVNQPIQQLMNNIGNSGRFVDESSYIRQYIYALDKTVEQNEKYVNELLVRRLLAGQPLHEDELARCETLLKKDYAHCMVMAVHMNHRPEHVVSLNARVYAHALVHFWQDAQRETLVCVLACDETGEAGLRHAEALLADPVFRGADAAALSPATDDPLQLSDSLLQANVHLREMLYQGRGGIEIADRPGARINAYPADTMHLLKRALRAEDGAAMRTHCDALCAVLLDPHMSPETGALVACDLAGLIPQLSEKISAPAQVFCDALRRSVSELADAADAAQPPQEQPEPDADQARQEIADAIEQMLECPGFGISTISEKFGMSDSAFSHMFKRTFGVTFISYVNQMKIQRSKALLNETNSSLDTIALRLGYSSASNFTRMFKKYEGITPGAYRQLARNGG